MRISPAECSKHYSISLKLSLHNKDRDGDLNITRGAKQETVNSTKQFETNKVLRKGINFHLLLYMEEYDKIH